MDDTLHIRLLQFAAGGDPVENLDRIRRLAGTASVPADLLLLPENCLCLGNHRRVAAAARPEPAWIELLAPLACELRTPIVFGGIPVRDGTRVLNRALVLDAAGSALARYDKVHLFQLDPTRPGGVDETRLYAHGTEPAAFSLRGWKIGLTICYDLRFPELFRHYAPADLVLCPAAFAQETGAAHWEILLRARAIENQCYVAAAAQCGANPDSGFAHFGHSLVAGPWGEIVAAVADAGGKAECVVDAALSRARLCEVRKRLPALEHRRM